MSGICGVINLDRAPVAESELHAMTAWLERRGPEATRTWHQGAAGVGHTLLATTPEAVTEQQPFVHSESGCVIVADARLDYRDDLMAALGHAERDGATGDAELILLAYLSWGEDCPRKMFGDFAFAIWDPREQKLFCARDPFGMRPLCYHYVPGQRLIFASDPRAILLLPQVPYQLNEGRIADFLVPGLEWIDYTSTFFDGVCRVPSAHSLTVDPGTFRITEHWSPEPGPELGILSDDDYREGFIEAFEHAIEWRLRSPPARVGVMLSGGMDSGSVAAFAKELVSARGEPPLATFSLARERGIDCAESRAIYASTAMPSLSPTIILADNAREDYTRWIQGFEEPFDTEYNFVRAIYAAAHAQGRTVVLDGGGGDLVLAEGSYIPRLIRQGNVRLALAEMRGEIRFWEEGSLATSLLRYGRAALLPEGLKRAWRRIVPVPTDREFLEDSMIAGEFAGRIDIKARCARYRETFARKHTNDYALESCNSIRANVTGGRERFARIAATTATEPRDPFLDRRLIEFCKHLPGRFRLRDGWYKWVLRDITAGRLPDEVRWMRGKPHIGSTFSTAVTAEAIRCGALELGTLQSELDGYVDASALSRAWQDFGSDVDPEPLTTAHALAGWMQENAQRPVVLD